MRRYAPGLACGFLLSLFGAFQLGADEIDTNQLRADAATLQYYGYEVTQDGAFIAGPRSYADGPIDTSFILREAFTLSAAREILFGCATCLDRRLGIAVPEPIKVKLIVQDVDGVQVPFATEDTARIIQSLMRSANLFDTTIIAAANDERSARMTVHISSDMAYGDSYPHSFATDGNDVRFTPWGDNCTFWNIADGMTVRETHMVITPKSARRCAGTLSALIFGLHPTERDAPSVLNPRSQFASLSVFDDWGLKLARRLPQKMTAAEFNAAVKNGDIGYDVRRF